MKLEKRLVVEKGDWALALCRNPISDAELERHVAFGGGYWFLDSGWIAGHKQDMKQRTWRLHRSRFVAEQIIPRPPDRFEYLGGKIEQWHTVGSRILILGASDSQTLYSTGEKQPRWLGDTIKAIRGLTSRPMLYRPKPTPNWDDPGIAMAGRMDVKVSTNKHLEDDLDDAWIVVGLRGTGFIHALFAGVPICMLADFEGKAWSTPLREIETPRRSERAPLAYDLAYREWTLAELRSGAPFRETT